MISWSIINYGVVLKSMFWCEECVIKLWIFKRRRDDE